MPASTTSSCGRHARRRRPRRMRQLLQLARAGVVLPEQRRRVRAPCAPRPRPRPCSASMPAVAICPTTHVAVAVEHQPRQAVGLAEHQPVVGLRVQPLAQRQRHVEPLHSSARSDGLVGIAADDARADQRVRIDVGVAQELVAVRDAAAPRAPGAKRRQRRRGDVDLVAEHPQVPGADAAVLAALQAQHAARTRCAAASGVSWAGRRINGIAASIQSPAGDHR